MDNEELSKKYVELIKKAFSDFDTEVAHDKADELLCRLLTELGFKDVADEFDKYDKWYA